LRTFPDQRNAVTGDQTLTADSFRPWHLAL